MPSSAGPTTLRVVPSQPNNERSKQSSTPSESPDVRSDIGGKVIVYASNWRSSNPVPSGVWLGPFVL